eukprot:9007538-Pyramimonas_sp.AAC.1
MAARGPRRPAVSVTRLPQQLRWRQGGATPQLPRVSRGYPAMAGRAPGGGLRRGLFSRESLCDAQDESAAHVILAGRDRPNQPE